MLRSDAGVDQRLGSRRADSFVIVVQSGGQRFDRLAHS
jgi:hypothetical protein